MNLGLRGRAARRAPRGFPSARHDPGVDSPLSLAPVAIRDTPPPSACLAGFLRPESEPRDLKEEAANGDQNQGERHRPKNVEVAEVGSRRASVSAKTEAARTVLLIPLRRIERNEGDGEP